MTTPECRAAAQPNCRFCAAPLDVVFIDLGMSPPANALLSEEQARRMERFYPLKAFVCERCFLVQLEEFETPQEIFAEYVYFSSYSSSWLAHAERYVTMIRPRLELDSASQVVEIASNDGYLLQYFKAAGVPVLGIDPARNVAEVAVRNGIPTRVDFFSRALAEELRAAGTAADLIVGNNVYAHVPDINDFTAGLRVLLKPQGTITLEFPHLLALMAGKQFDTIYHEHFQYYSLLTVRTIFARHQLEIFDVEELPTHGGSLRIYARHANGGSSASANVERVIAAESSAGLGGIEAYRNFAPEVFDVKSRLLEFLIATKRDGKRIAAYGAAAKGTTLLNYCGIRTDFIDYIVDRNPAKQQKLLPGCRIPIVDVPHVYETKPDYLLILPWNIKDEIIEQMADIRRWGGQFIVPVPVTQIA